MCPQISEWRTGQFERTEDGVLTITAWPEPISQDTKAAEEAAADMANADLAADPQSLPQACRQLNSPEVQILKRGASSSRHHLLRGLQFWTAQTST
ncbi:hypothetical protein WJX73_010788 [Symbiochloris irregularis]